MITDYEIIKFRDTMQRLIDKSTNSLQNAYGGCFYQTKKINNNLGYFSLSYCKSGNIRGTLIFAYFAQIQQARIQKPAKIFAVPK